MNAEFTNATLFWLFVPMPLLIVFSFISLFKQMFKEKALKNQVNANMLVEKEGS